MRKPVEPMDSNLLFGGITVALGVATWAITAIGTRQKRLERSSEDYIRALTGRMELLETERNEARNERDACEQEINALRNQMNQRITAVDDRILTLQKHLQVCEQARTALYIENLRLTRERAIGGEDIEAREIDE